MKDKIIEVIDNNINTPFAEHEFNSLVDQLAALMCYREVMAIIKWTWGTDTSCFDIPELEDGFYMQFHPEYTNQQIRNAIEQVKKEMK